MRISTRLIVLVTTALLGIACVVALSLHELNDALIANRQAEAVNLLAKAEHMVESYRELEASGKMTRDEAQAAAKRTLNALNADKKSYYWVMNPNGLMLVHPVAELVGVRMVGKGALPGETDLDAYRRGLSAGHYALVDVLIQRSQNGRYEAKLQGVVAVPEWNWWIGTGFFYDNIEAAFWRTATRLIAISAANLRMRRPSPRRSRRAIWPLRSG